MTPINVFEGLLNHFQAIADAFDDPKLAGAIFPEARGKTPAREAILESFLVGHLPRRCQIVRGGRIFDASGAVSDPIDVLVTGDLAIELRQPEGSFHCLESCHAAICVSAVLDENACFDTLRRLASVPLVEQVPPEVAIMFGQRAKTQGNPMRTVFAFDGPGAEATLRHLQEFYTCNPGPEPAIPGMIIVNNRYGIVRMGEKGAMTTSGVEIPPHSFHAFGIRDTEPSIGGYSLMYLLTQIQKAVAAGSQGEIDYGEYVDQLPL